jgi:hypothetical protein
MPRLLLLLPDRLNAPKSTFSLLSTTALLSSFFSLLLLVLLWMFSLTKVCPSSQFQSLTVADTSFIIGYQFGYIIITSF